MKKPSILLIDANALIHRAFHALPPLTTKEGEMVNAVYGFSLILLKAIKDIKPEYIAIAFDHPKPTFRHKAYKEYKATRQKAPDDLVEQFPKVKEVVKALNFPIFEKEGFEADDIVGTLSRKANDKGIEAIIVTGDSDEIQLVNKQTKVYTMRRGFTDTILYDVAKVKEKYEGLTPDKLIELKALRGDPSDNVAGVPGIGEKTALTLIKEFCNVENLYKQLKMNSPKIETIKPKILESLKNHKQTVKTSKELVTIITDMNLEINLEDSRVSNYSKQAALEIFKKYGFKTLFSKLPDSEVSEKKPNKNNDFDYKIIKNIDALKKALQQLKKSDECVVDTETETLDDITGQIIGISLSNKENLGFYINIESKKSELWSEIKKFLEDSRVKKIGHNLKYDLNVLKTIDINLSPIYFDTMIAYYLLHPGERRFNLNDLAFSELGYEMTPIENLIGKKGKTQKKMSEVPEEKIAQYSAEDAVITYRLYKKIKTKIASDKTFDLFKNIEMPIVSILAAMERTGVKIDEEILKEMSQETAKKIKKLEDKICQIANCDFNINSPLQLKKVLYQDLKLQEKMDYPQDLKKLKSGGYSTASSMLEKLKGAHKIIPLIQNYRELSKLKNTYIDSLPKLINKETKRLHTSFNQTITSTGRLSSSNPNLQNIPIRTETGREIRKAFVAKKGFKLISADYSQIELRIIAHLSNDESMINSFLNHEDIHTRTAAEVNEVSLDKVTYEMRSAAKATNFGIVYGIGAHGLSEQLGWTHEEAKKYINKYHEKHPRLIAFLKETIEKTKKYGYAETLLGRKRYIPEINSSNFQVRASGERMAINFPAQGTAADFIKKAMINIAEKINSVSPKSKMIIQVHDELVFETPKNDVIKMASFIEKSMENVYKNLAVPIQVDISYGNNWKEMKNIIKGDKNKVKGFQH